MHNREKVFQKFRSHGLRLTPIRKELIEHFINATRPLCYDDLKTLIPMDKATFYRNMQSFEHATLLRKIESDDKKWYFELANDIHAHFICDNCHSVECLAKAPMQALSGYRIDTIVYKGICPKCSA